MTLQKFFYFGIGLIICLIIGIFIWQQFLSKNIQTTEQSVQSSEPQNLELKFAQLSKARTNLCAGPDFLFSMSDKEKLQGSCCSPMDFHQYQEQIEGLKKYSDIEKIPSDPYDIPVSLAKELLNYQKTIQLSAEQQAIYDKAVKMSDEGGPCCCKCWRWYAFEGLAKYLITKYNFKTEQIAEIWDLEDGCGGPGHIEEMHHT